MPKICFAPSKSFMANIYIRLTSESRCPPLTFAWSTCDPCVRWAGLACHLCNYFVDKHEFSLLQQNYSDFINKLYFQYHFQENASENMSSSSANRASPPYSVWQTQCLLHLADWFSFFFLSRAASLLSKPDSWAQPVFPEFRLLFLRLKIPTLLSWSAKVFQLLLQSLGKWTYASQTNVSKWL